MKITKEMTIAEVVETYPQTVEVFMRYGLGCLGCAIARMENIEQGAAVHGISIESLIEDLNKAVGTVVE